jgi:DNA primase
MDKYASIRNLPFSAVANLLGLDLSRFKQKKHEYQGYCPIHESKENNTCFSYNNDTGTYHCFSCQAKGRGSIDLVMAVKGIKFSEACEFLSQMPAEAPNQPQDERSPQNGIVTSAMDLQPFKGSYQKFAVQSDWLNNRIPDKEVLTKYGVFFYSNPARKSLYSGKIMIPIKRFEDGELMGYLARTPEPKEGESKYLFPRDFPKHLFLFGAWELKQGQVPYRVIYLVESPFSVLKFCTYNLPAVSPFGWSVSDEQIEILKTLAKGVIYLPDSNKYQEAQSFAGKLASHLWVRMPAIPTEDPESLTLEQLQAL